MSEQTLRPVANGTTNSWSSKGAKEKWEEVGQEAVEPSEPLTSRGIKSPAETNKSQSLQFTWPTLSGSQKIIGAVVHMNGNWTTKLRVNAADQTAAGVGEGEIESAVGGELNHWANSTKNNWTKLKGPSNEWPWTPWTRAELEKLVGGGHFQITFITGKATAQEVFELYVIATIVGSIGEGAGVLVSGGLLAPAGTRIGTGIASTGGGGFLQGAGAQVGVGSAAFIGGGQLILSGKEIAVGSGVIAVGGRFFAFGGRQAVGSGAIAGGGRALAVGTRVGQGSALLRGGGKVSSSGLRIAIGTASLASGGKLSPTVKAILAGTARLTGGARLLVQGSKVGTGTSSVRGGARLIATGGKQATGAASLRGGGRFSIGTATRIAQGTAKLAGGGILQALGEGEPRPHIIAFNFVLRVTQLEQPVLRVVEPEQPIIKTI